MDEYQVTETIMVKVDKHGHLTIMQMDPVIQPQIAVNRVSMRIEDANTLLVVCEQILRKGVRQIGAA